MFKCQKCGANSAPKEKATKQVVQYREVRYASRQNANPRMSGESAKDPGGKGYEIVKEITIGPCCV